MKNSSIEDEIGIVLGGSSSFIKTDVVAFKQHYVFFDEDIGDPSKYRDLRHLLYNADEIDQFVFLINSPGGDLYSALGIIEAMKHSEAKIHSIVEGTCMSAATLILLNSNSIALTDSAVIMCHSASHGVSGSTQSVRRQAEFMDKQWHDLEKKTYSGFLSDDEMSDMSKGVEHYFDSTESKRRLKKWAALKNKK